MRPAKIRTALTCSLTFLLAQAPLMAAAVPVAPQAYQVAALGDNLTKLTSRVHEYMGMQFEDHVASYMRDLRTAVLAEDELSDEEWGKVLELRNEVATQGYDVGSWADWNYDDRELSDAEKALVDKVEKRLVRDRYNPDKVLAAYKELKPILARPEYTAEEGNIRDFLDMWAQPKLAGMQLSVNRYYIKFFREWYNTPFRLVGQNKPLEASKGLEELRELVAIFQSNDLVDITDWEVAVPDADGDTQKITLKEAIKRLDDLTAKIAKLVEAEKKKRASEIAKWGTVMKGDKAKIYKERGVPDAWVYVQTGFTTEDAAKSPWWVYYERISHSYWYRHKFTFNTNQQVINREQSVVYFPNVP